MEALDGLGEAAKSPIVTELTRRAHQIAKEFGGAAKPSGAGGGDIGVAIFPDADAAKGFHEKCPAGVTVLDLAVNAGGVQRKLP